MISTCSECETAAARYWGERALCVEHLRAAQAAEVKLKRVPAHACTTCGEMQPGNVAWKGDRPCGRCRVRGETAAASGAPSVEAALVACRLYEGFPGPAQAMAKKLAEDGVTAFHVEQLGAWADRTWGKSRKRNEALVATLGDPGRRNEVLADLARRVRSGRIDDAKPSSPDQWSEGDAARRVVALVDGDHKTLEFVCEAFGFEPGRAADLLAAGREIIAEERRERGRPTAPPPNDGGSREPHEKQLSTFRRAMAEAEQSGRPFSEVLQELRR